MFVKWLDSEETIMELRSWTHPDPEFDRSLYEPTVYEAPGPSNSAYEALSYVWGSQDDPELAFVETTSGTPVGTVPLGRNLESALRHLRYETAPRNLWVDAICINQADKIEKSVQVRRMAHIYQSAARVIAWIGPAMQESDLAMSTLEYLGCQLVATVDGRLMPSPDAQEEDWYESDKALPYGLEIWQALHRLLTREWFHRRWVIQEITLANPTALLLCGKRAFPWSCLRRAISGLVRKFSLPQRVRNAVIGIWNIIDPRGDVQRILRAVQDTLCCDPLDDVYALLGILPPKFAARIEVDYSASVANMYRDVFLLHVTHVQRWELFGCSLKDRMCGGPS
jgi:hypothetical protein